MKAAFSFILMALLRCHLKSDWGSFTEVVFRKGILPLGVFSLILSCSNGPTGRASVELLNKGSDINDGSLIMSPKRSVWKA